MENEEDQEMDEGEDEELESPLAEDEMGAVGYYIC